MNKYDRWTAKAIGLGVSALIAGIIALNILSPDRAFSEMENRSLAQSPAFSWDDFVDKKFTDNFEKYIADQFPLRDIWIGVKTDFALLIGQNISNGVYLGKDGYLLQEFKHPSTKDLESKLAAINVFADNTPDVNKYFMLVPNAVQILKDKLPPYAPTDDQSAYLNEVKSGLDKSITFVDVYDTLAEHQKENIYYRTDHHWTTLGAFYGYQALGKAMGLNVRDQNDYRIEKVTDNFLGSLYSKSGFKHLGPDSIELYHPKLPETYNVKYFDTEEETDSLYVLNDLNKKDKYTVFFNGNQSLIKISTSTNNGKKLLVIKDSYANSLLPFLTSDYNEIYVVDLRYYSDDLSQLIKDNNIKDALFLYNVNTFAEDQGLRQLGR